MDRRAEGIGVLTYSDCLRIGYRVPFQVPLQLPPENVPVKDRRSAASVATKVCTLSICTANEMVLPLTINGKVWLTTPTDAAVITSSACPIELRRTVPVQPALAGKAAGQPAPFAIEPLQGTEQRVARGLGDRHGLTGHGPESPCGCRRCFQQSIRPPFP